MKGHLSFLLVTILAVGLASPAAGGAPRFESEPEREWLRPEVEELYQDGICVWECNDGTRGGCYPPPEYCYAECESACSAHGGIDICGFDTIPPAR